MAGMSVMSITIWFLRVCVFYHADGWTNDTTRMRRSQSESGLASPRAVGTAFDSAGVAFDSVGTAFDSVGLEVSCLMFDVGRTRP